jgi:acyl-coenzyme A thioesterase PaaI-like protein
MTTTVDEPSEAGLRRHVLRDLGWSMAPDADGLSGSAAVVDGMLVPGTDSLRTSILATWADMLAGTLVARAISPRVPVTLELDVHLFAPAPGSGTVRGTSRMVKSGRSVSVAAVEFGGDDDGPIGIAAASFVPVPDERLTLPLSVLDRVDDFGVRGPTLEVPFAERVGCERRSAGRAVLPHSDEVLNASNTVNGGLIALVIEEAVLSRAPGATLSSLALRYLQPVRTGPVEAEATLRLGLAQAEVRDAGNDNRLCVTATGRVFGAAGSP